MAAAAPQCAKLKLGCNNSACNAKGCTACAVGTYSSTTKSGLKACLSCPPGCSRCSAASRCTGCKTGFVLVSKTVDNKATAACQRPPPPPKRKPSPSPNPKGGLVTRPTDKMASPAPVVLAPADPLYDPCCDPQSKVQCFAACRCCKNENGYIPDVNCRKCDASPEPEPEAPKADPCCNPKLKIYCFVKCRCCEPGDGYVAGINCQACDASPAPEEKSPPAEEAPPKPEAEGYDVCCDPNSKVPCFAPCRACVAGDGYVAGWNCTATDLPCCPPALRMSDTPGVTCRDCGFRG